MEYLSPERVELVYTMPLAEVVLDFFDQLKSRTKGYASLDYEPAGYATNNLVRVDILINHAPATPSPPSCTAPRPTTTAAGWPTSCGAHPRQMFDVPIQAPSAAHRGRETVKAKRKDVLSKCYGGDITASASCSRSRKRARSG